MEPKFQSSFIPKGPLATTGTATRISRQSERSFLGTLSVFVFILAILAAGGAYGYQWYLQRSIGQMGQSLAAARTTLDPDTINRISSLSQRMTSTKTLLDNHQIISPLFTYLENSTLKTVQFTKFSYTSGDEGLLLKMDGVARGYNALALQSQIFSSSPYLKNIVFENLSLNDKGDVTFTMSATLDPSVTSFKSEVNRQDTPVAVPDNSFGTSTPQ